MEDLNKNQIVLLTLLVSFVTSIATGIMTVSLLQQAPLEVTRTINSVVEKTIEKVTTPSTITNSGQKEVTTVVVKEEDQVINAINKNVKSIVRITEHDPFADVYSFYGMGLVMTSDGLIAADRNQIVLAHEYTATMNDGTKLTLAPLGFDKKTNFVLFRATIPDGLTLVPASLASDDAQLGQTVIIVGGESTNSVIVGRVSSLITKNITNGSSTTPYLSSVDTDIASTKDIVDGSPYFNLSGDIVGIKLSNNDLKSFTPARVLKNELPGLSQ